MKVCDMDCFNCKYKDCIKNDTYSEKSRYCNRSAEARNHQKERAKKKRDEARKQGLCCICLKKPQTHGAKCYECYLRQKRYDQKKNTGERERWKDEGKCYYCGADVVPGKKTCSIHYAKYKVHGQWMAKLPQSIAAQKRFTEWHWNMRKGEINE